MDPPADPPRAGAAARPAWLALVVAAAVLPACREADAPGGPLTTGSVAFDSEPRGAHIVLDGIPAGAVTPDTIRGLARRRHAVTLFIDSAGFRYLWNAAVEPVPDSVVSLFRPLLFRCRSDACFIEAAREHAPNRITFVSNPQGQLFYVWGRGDGLFWPAESRNSYASGGFAVLAAVRSGTTDTVSLGPYNDSYTWGRPAPRVSEAGGTWARQVESWVLPRSGAFFRRTIRGIGIEQRVVAEDAAQDALLVHLVFRNVTDRPSYVAIDPVAFDGGITYEDVWIGFALDPYIGDPDDDLVGLVPERNAAFVYDSDFHEAGFGEWSDRPALVGLRLLDAPAGARVVLNAFRHGQDWQAGYEGQQHRLPESVGWAILSGTEWGPPLHPDPAVGWVPQEPGNYRISVSAGPLTLAPGDSAHIMALVALAAPAPGSYESGTLISPGDPFDPQRPILGVAGPLLEVMEEAAARLSLRWP